MGVVYVYGDSLRELLPVVSVQGLESADDGAQARGHQEILLLEPELPSYTVAVLGIEYARYGLYVAPDLSRSGIVARVEGVHVDGIVDGPGVPQMQNVHVLAVKAYDRHVVRYRAHACISLVLKVEFAVPELPVDVASETHFGRSVSPLLLPRIAVRQPCVGQSHLIAVIDLLSEKTEMIP